MDESNLSLNDIYTFMNAMGENLERKIDGIQRSTDNLSTRIEEVNNKITEDIVNLTAKQINDNQDRKVEIEKIANDISDHKEKVGQDISTLKEELRAHENRLQNQEKEIYWKTLRIKELETSVHRGLQHGRGWNLEIEGIPINVGDEPAQLQQAVIRILGAINVPVETYEIDTVHRLVALEERAQDNHCTIHLEKDSEVGARKQA